jgi:hypothetical protein
MHAAFGVCRHVKSSDVADPAGRLKRPVKEVLRQTEARRAAQRAVEPSLRLHAFSPLHT